MWKVWGSITCHTSHITCKKCQKYHKCYISPENNPRLLCDNILEMSTPHHNYGTVINVTRYITCHITHNLSQISQITRKHPQDTCVTPFWKCHRVLPIRAMLYGIITVPWWCWGGDISKMLSHKGSRAVFWWFLKFVLCDVWFVTCNGTPRYTKKLPYQNVAIYSNILVRQFSVRTFPYTRNTNVNRYN